MTTAYPLAWPAGWPRSRYTKAWKQAAKWTFSRATAGLVKELRLLGATHVVISTNYELGTRTGLPKKGGRIDDKGVAVYFTYAGQKAPFTKRQMVMACDQYSSAEGNIRSLTLAIAGMRALERHGGGHMMERAFSGFEALPPPSASGAPPKRTCWQILGITRPDLADAYAVKKSHRNRVMENHPDQGGSEAIMSELNVARDEALAIVAKRGPAR